MKYIPRQAGTKDECFLIDVTMNLSKEGGTRMRPKHNTYQSRHRRQYFHIGPLEMKSGH